MIPYIKGRQLFLRGAGYKESNHGRYQILYLQILCMKTKIIKENMLYFLSRTYIVLVGLEEDNDSVPRKELWYCIAKSGVAGKYVKDMNEDGITT